MKQTIQRTIALGVIALLVMIGTFTACSDSDFPGNLGNSNNNDTTNDSDDTDSTNNSSSSGNDSGGTSRSNALLVTVGYSSSRTIGSSGQHWFKFVGTGDPVIFETEGNVVDTYIDVYVEDSNYSNLYGGSYDDNSGGGSNALVSRGTVSGTTYYIKITPRSGTSGAYTFMVKAPTFNIRTNPITVTVGNSSSHTISSNGTHWFKFTGDGKRVFFETEGNVVNTEIKIYIGDNTNYSYDWKEKVNFITVLGQAYYISITGNSGTYTFNLRNGTGDGSSRYNAQEVTKGYSSSHTISYSGIHWFIYQGTGEPVTFKTTGNVVDTYIDVYVEDSNYSNLYGGSYDDNSGEGSNALIKRNTISGTTYYIKITPKSGTSGAYTFIVE